MTKHLERLMSRASVTAMAAHAKEPVSTLPQFAERVEETPAAGGDRERPDPIDGLSAEEQAQLDAMQAGTVDGGAEADAAAGEGDPDPDGDPPADGDGDGGEVDPPADGAPADGQPRKVPKTISYGRHERDMARAKKEREDLQAQLDAALGETKKEREARLRLDERANMLLQAIQKAPAAPAPAPAVPAANPDPEPDREVDPLGHMEWRLRKSETELASLKNGQQKRDEVTAQQTEEQRVLTALDADVGRAIAADPSFADAFAHLRETRFRELGFIFADIDINDKEQCAQLTPQEQAALSQNIQRTFMNEQLLVAGEAVRSGKSPATKILNLARSRGWTKPAPAPDPAAGDPPPRVPAAGAKPPPAVRPAPDAAPSVRQQLDAVRDNLDASRSLSDAGGSPGGQIDARRLGEMTDAEFQRYYDQMPKDQLDALMGKPANM